MLKIRSRIMSLVMVTMLLINVMGVDINAEYRQDQWEYEINYKDRKENVRGISETNGTEMPETFMNFLKKLNKHYKDFGVVYEREIKEEEDNGNRYLRLIKFNRKVTEEEFSELEIKFLDSNLKNVEYTISMAEIKKDNGEIDYILEFRPASSLLEKYKPYIIIIDHPKFKNIYTKTLVITDKGIHEKDEENKKEEENHTDIQHFVFNKELGEITSFRYIKDKDISKVVVPKFIEGIEVKSIGKYAFLPEEQGDEVRIRELILPKTIESISSSALLYNRALSSVNFKDLSSLREIGPSAFKGCALTGRIELPDNLIYIGSNAFSENHIRYITFNDNLEFVEDGAFSQNNIVEVDLSNTKIRNIYDKTFYKNEISYIVPSRNLKSIGNSAFAEQNSKYIDKSEIGALDLSTVEMIGDFSFEGLDFDWGTILVGENLREIGGYAFNRSNISIIENLYKSKILEIKPYTFAHCNLSNLYLPETFRELKDLAIVENKNFKLVKIPKEAMISSAAVMLYKDDGQLEAMQYEILKY